MDCDMDTSDMPASAQAPEQSHANGVYPFSSGFGSPSNGHPLLNGFAPQSEPSQQNGFHPFTNGFPPQQVQPPQENGFCGLEMKGSVVFHPGQASHKRGREEEGEEESRLKRPCPEGTFTFM